MKKRFFSFLLCFICVCAVFAQTDTLEESGTVASGSGSTVTPSLESMGWTSESILPTDKWEIKIQVSQVSEHFNEYGSCILATGTNPTATKYDYGFQIFLRQPADGSDKRRLLCKVGVIEYYFSTLNCEKDFNVTLAYDGCNTLTVTAEDCETDKEETLVLSVGFTSITGFCYAVSDNVKITGLTIESLNDSGVNSQSLFDANKKYVLRTSKGFFLNLDANDNGATTSKGETAATFGDTPSVFTIVEQDGGYTFTDENGHSVGISKQYTWNVSNLAADISTWTVHQVSDEFNGYYIRCNAGFLGNNTLSTSGAYVFTNQPQAFLWYVDEYDYHFDGGYRIPGRNLTEMSTIEKDKQYVQAISASVNGAAATEIYTTETCPTSVFHHADRMYVKAGDEITISWTGGAGMAYCYLSAYLDSDGDGTFDATPFATMGTANSTDQSVISNTVTFTVPSGVKQTRVRLRFDTAWSIGAIAHSASSRMVYDIPLILSTEGDIHLEDNKTSLKDITVLLDRSLKGKEIYTKNDLNTLVKVLLNQNSESNNQESNQVEEN